MSESKKISLFDAVKHVLSLRDYYLTYDVNMLSIREKNENLINITKAKYYVGHIKKQIAKDTNGQFLAKYIKCINVILKNDWKSGDIKTGWKMTRALNMLQLTDLSGSGLQDLKTRQSGLSIIDKFREFLDSQYLVRKSQSQDTGSIYPFVFECHNQIIELKNNFGRYEDIIRSSIYKLDNEKKIFLQNQKRDHQSQKGKKIIVWGNYVSPQLV